MLHTIKDLLGFAIGATDGGLGEVTDIYFDDERWTIRYIVVATGRWLHGRKVLISPMSVFYRIGIRMNEARIVNLLCPMDRAGFFGQRAARVVRA